MSQPQTPRTHLMLMRKYHGLIMKATPEEMQAAADSLPAGSNALAALFYAAREYEAECAAAGDRSLCWNKGGLCEEDHCRCYDGERKAVSA